MIKPRLSTACVRRNVQKLWKSDAVVDVKGKAPAVFSEPRQHPSTTSYIYSTSTRTHINQLGGDAMIAHRHMSTSQSRAAPGTPSSSGSKTPPPPIPPPLRSSSSSTAAGLGTTHLSPDIMLRCTIFDSSGSAKSSSGVFKKSTLCSDNGLEPRDLRKIDSRVPNLVPTILARRGSILVNILHIRAMIKRDKVLLFDSYGSTDSQLHSAFVYNLQHNLRPFQQVAGQNCAPPTLVGGLAYEFRALESILVSVLDALRIELDVVRNWTSSVLQELDEDVDREKLRTLLQVSRKLNSFLSRAKAVKNAVVEVLENEEDMQLMYLSVPPASSDNATTSEASNNRDDPTLDDFSGSGGTMDQLELLLESFDKQVEEVVAETSQLLSDINNTQEVVELILDNTRNKLLALDLKTSITTMGISAGTLWAGLFGMNLRTNMEDMDYAFSAMSGVAFLAVALTSGAGLRRLHRLRRGGLGQGNTTLKRPNKGFGRLSAWWHKDRRSLEDRSHFALGNEPSEQQQYYAAPLQPPAGYTPTQQYATPTDGASYQSTAYEFNPAAATGSATPASYASTSSPRSLPATESNASALGLGDKWNTRKKKRTP